MDTQQAQTKPYREHLKRHGYTFRSSRHGELSRANATAGQRMWCYTVTLYGPDGKQTRHDAPDHLYLAYAAACGAAGIGQPPVTAGDSPSGPAGQEDARSAVIPLF